MLSIELDHFMTCYFYMAIYTNDPTDDISLPINLIQSLLFHFVWMSYL